MGDIGLVNNGNIKHVEGRLEIITVMEMWNSQLDESMAARLYAFRGVEMVSGVKKDFKPIPFNR